MKRYSIKELTGMPQDRNQLYNYKDQVAVISPQFYGLEAAGELFAIDAFAVGYIIKGYSITEFNTDTYHLVPGNLFILAPTHSCRIIECSRDYTVRILLLDSNGHNLSVHLNYLVKSERWTQTYFHPVLKLSADEAITMRNCLERIVEQIAREDCPNRIPFIRLATVWHHVELDNIMQIHMKEITDNGKPLTRQQALGRELVGLHTQISTIP